MNTNPKHALIEALAMLARAAPSDWERFLGEYRLHYGRAADMLVSAPPEILSHLQGRAKEAREFMELCISCREEADKIMRSRNG